RRRRSFPTRRSSDLLFVGDEVAQEQELAEADRLERGKWTRIVHTAACCGGHYSWGTRSVYRNIMAQPRRSPRRRAMAARGAPIVDRTSTRLNSSHVK